MRVVSNQAPMKDETIEKVGSKTALKMSVSLLSGEERGDVASI